MSAKTAVRRRGHYVALIAAAPSSRQRLNAAVDYLRAAVARAPERTVSAVVERLVAMADEEGDLR